MKLQKLLLSLTILGALLYSCDDNTDGIGGSIIDNFDNVNVACDTFSVFTESKEIDSVYSRSSIGYLGKVKDPETNGTVEGNFSTQFYTLEGTQLPKEESIASRLGDGSVIADSCILYLYYDNYFGDSLSTMKLKVTEMGKALNESKKYYSNNDLNSYLRKDKGAVNTNKTYTLYDLAADTIQKKIRIKLPNSKLNSSHNIDGEPVYKSNETLDGGKGYYNYGTYLMRKYYEKPSNYKNAYNFINKVCPGFKFQIQDGLGSMAYIDMSQLLVYYRYSYEKTNSDGTKKDTTVNVVSTFAGTEEVIQSTNIRNQGTAISKIIKDGENKGYTWIKSPAGIYTEMTIPVDDIIRGHENDTINSARVSLVRVNDEKADEKYHFDKPSSLLMIPDTLYKDFFENGKLADNIVSYIAVHSTSDSYSSLGKENSYTFHNIANLIKYMKAVRDEGVKTDPEWEAKNANWNKVRIIPVSTTYATVGQSQTLVKVENNMGLTETRLVKGDGIKYENNKENIKVKMIVVYSKFNKKQ